MLTEAQYVRLGFNLQSQNKTSALQKQNQCQQCMGDVSVQSNRTLYLGCNILQIMVEIGRDVPMH